MTLLDAPPATPTAADPELLFREARQRRRRRWLITGTFGVVVMVILASTAIVLFGKSAGRSASTGGLRPVPTPVGRVHPYPKQMVIVNAQTQDLQVISSTTGDVLRNLSSDAGSFDGTIQASVSPSGVVYFDHAGRAGTEPSEQIWSVPLSGGRSTFVADGHTPVVSPNGALLAYLTWTALTNAPASIVVMNIATGASTTWSYSTYGPEISGLSWAPDSRSLVFATSTPTGVSWANGAWSVPIDSANRSLDATRPIPLLPNAFWVGYLNDTQALEVLDQSGGSQPIVVDVATGQVVKRLSVLSEPSATPPGSSGRWQIDPAANTANYVALLRQRSLPNGAGIVTDLYRWSIHSPTVRPTLVKRGVGSSAWVPGS
jgi:hypothetical protein